MALTLVPPQIKLPSIEPICLAFLAALQQNLPAALAIIEAQYPSPSISLPVPDVEYGYSREVVKSYNAVQNFPLVTVFSGQSGNVQPAQQLGGGGWLGQIRADAFLQNSDSEELTISLDRYVTALWLVALNADEQRALAGAGIDYGSVQFQPDPSLGSGNTRATELRFNVFWRV